MIEKNKIIFAKYIGDFKKWEGINALNWAKYVDAEFNDEKLNKKLTRIDLLSKEFVDGLDNIAISYAILSWGGMNREHGKALFAKSEWLDIVHEIRNKIVTSREEAFEKFYLLKEENKLPGMGPAYFTKLICFLNPELNGYIMDQWTAKSVNVICGKEVVKLTPQGFVDTIKNNASVYLAFCDVIDKIAEEMKMKGIDVEESMFSNGGRKKGGWRSFLIENWNSKNASRLLVRLNDEFDVVTFSEVLEKVGGESVQVDTLANKSKIIIKVDKDVIWVTLSSGKKYKIQESVWSSVLIRIQELPQAERLMSSRYVDGKNVFNWKGCPNRVVCPYVPAIMRHFNL